MNFSAIPAAMIEWTAPYFLWGLPLAFLPLLLHWLRRRRYERLCWAATHVLEKALRRTRVRRRFHHVALMILRTLILLLMLIVASGPRWTGVLPGAIRTDTPVLRILVFDISGSMQYEVMESHTRLDLAKEWGREIVAAGSPDDRILLATIGGRFRWVSPSPLAVTSNWETLLRKINATPERTTPDSAAKALLEYGSKHFHDESEYRTEIYWISDMCRIGWAASRSENDTLLKKAPSGTIPPDFSESLRKDMKRLSRANELIFVDVGQREYENHGVLGLEIVSPPVLPGGEVAIRTALGEYLVPSSSNTIEEIPVTLTIDGQRAGRRVCGLTPGRPEFYDFSWRWFQSGESTIEVSLPDDRLDADNRRAIRLPIPERLSVLMVSPEKNRFEESFSPAEFLRLALQPEESKGATAMSSPTTADRRQPLPIELQEISFSELPRQRSLENHDVIVLAGFQDCRTSVVQTLTDYLRAGGNIVMFPGTSVAVDDWNDAVFGNAPPTRRWLEGELSPVEEVLPFENENQSPRWLKPHGFSHEILQPFADHPRSGLLNLPIFSYYPLRNFEKEDAREEGRDVEAVLSLAEGNPIIVAGEIALTKYRDKRTARSRGRLVLVTVPLDREAGAMAVWPSFVPLVQQMVRWASASRFQGREIESEGIDRPPFDRRESDLTKIEPETFLRNFLGEIPAKYIEVVPEEPKEASQTQKLFSLQASAKSPALTPELLLLLLGLVLVENVLSRRDSSRSFL